MSGMGNRRSDRISIALPVDASGIDAENHPFIDTATTIVLNRHGARLAVKQILKQGQTISLIRKLSNGTQRKAEARIVVRERDVLGVPAYGIAFVDPDVDFWEIEFPSREESSGAIVRLLVECTHCRSQELAYLNGRELKEFETDRLFARQCKTCEAPTIWKQPHEAMARQRSSTDTTESALSAPENNAREIPRYDTRLTACVRVGSEDEMAVCENVSKQGIAFRSQRKYGVGTEVEIAVPFTAGTANVFIPAVIMHSRPLPSAGLNRHGAKYMHKDKT